MNTKLLSSDKWVIQFNKEYPVGSVVKLESLSGEISIVTVKEPAKVLNGSPVVRVNEFLEPISLLKLVL